MKALGETLSLILVIAFLMAVCFVFDGSPDLWDKWRDRAINSAGCSSAGEIDAQ